MHLISSGFRYLHAMSSRCLAVCSWSLRPSDPAQLVERMKQSGMKAVQLDFTPLVDAPEIWKDATQRLADAGMVIASGMMRPRGEDYSTIASIRATGGVRPDATWVQNQQLAARVAELASRAGVSLVSFHGGCLPHDQSDPQRAIMRQRLQILIDLFQASGVRVAFETGQERAEHLLEALHEINRPTAGVNFDPANMLLYGAGNPMQALAILHPWVRQVHAKDAHASAQSGAWGKETPLGEGEVPWTEFMSVVRSLSTGVSVVIEREGGDRRVEEVASARAFLEPML